ncbi:MMPL family transporter [Nocardia inohanensis]|uniref:MMPL family transporter n=1 Tax=Nocardia inohanensis TaxID=209246 RepID=UPI000830D755|nr:MMPL family transporter [Nocardia inohanensis]
MFSRLGRFVVNKPWLVIGVWLIAIVGVVAIAPKLAATTDQSDFLPSHYESIQAAEVQKKAFPDSQPPAALIVFERADDAPLTDIDLQTVQTAVAKLNEKKIENITGIVAGEPPQNRLVDVVAVGMTKMESQTDTRQGDAVKALRDALREQTSGTDLKAGVTGTAASNLDQTESGNKGLAIILVATILLIIVLLLVIFRSPVIALLPILVIMALSPMATGLIGMAAEAFDLKIDNSVQALLSIVMFGVGTDYILFLMFRFRERLRAGDDAKTAVINAVERVGEAITSAAAAVIIAFGALTLSSMGMFRSMGYALAIAVAVTLAAGLTLVPAIVSLLGTKVFWPSKAWQVDPKGARFTAIGSALGKRPAVFAVASGGVLLALGVFALGFNPTFDLSSGSTSNAAESVVYQKEMLKGMPAGTTQPSQVYLSSAGAGQLSDDQLNNYRTALTGVEGVGQVSPPKLSQDKTIAEYQVTLNSAPESDAALDIVSGPLRDTAHSAAPTGTEARVGGLTSIFVDFKAAMNRDYKVVFPVAAILIMLVLGLLLRSVVAPWYLMASVFLGFAATLGSAVLIFQHVQGDTGLIFTMPIIMYLFVVALGTDYNILMVARLREEAREGNDPHTSAALAVRHTGPTIAAAGLILAGSFASMMLAGNSMLEQMGFAISVGIAIAAFIMAMFFTPAVTALIGRKAWWPGHGGDARQPIDDASSDWTAYDYDPARR